MLHIPRDARWCVYGILQIEWLRIVPDLIFGILGVIPIVLAALLTYLAIRKQPATA